MQPDASNADRDFTSYFTLLSIKILLSLRRPEKSSITLLQVRSIGNFTFIAKKKVKTKKQTLSGVMENIRDLRISKNKDPRISKNRKQTFVFKIKF